MIVVDGDSPGDGACAEAVMVMTRPRIPNLRLFWICGYLRGTQPIKK
jgi:hypothetical protein